MERSNVIGVNPEKSDKAQKWSCKEEINQKKVIFNNITFDTKSITNSFTN